MKRFIKIFLLLVTGCWLLVTSVIAQGQAGTDIAVLNAGVGARPLGMGGAFTAIADNADAPYWNPAGLGFLASNEITAMQTRLSTDADHYYISYVCPILGGTLGLSWIQVGLGTIAQTSSEVNLNNEVQNISIFSYFSNAYLLAFGKKLNDSISLGLTGAYLTSDMMGISGGQAWGYSFAPGILLRPAASNWQLGLKIEELFNSQSWGTGTVEKVPSTVRLGVAARGLPLIGGLLAVDVSQQLRSAYAPSASLGYEWDSPGGLSFRGGYAGGGFTAGAGFKVGHARVDYAYVNQNSLTKNNVHRISLSGIW